MPAALPLRLHATAIAMGGMAALIRGPSGSGKSDLALRCLALPPGPFTPRRMQLVSDDYCELYAETAQPAGTADTVQTSERAALYVRAPANIAGLIEVRGVGIIEIEPVASARACLIADLVDKAVVERLPDSSSAQIEGYELPLLRLDPFEGSAPLKLSLALHKAATDLQSTG